MLFWQNNERKTKNSTQKVLVKMSILGTLSVIFHATFCRWLSGWVHGMISDGPEKTLSMLFCPYQQCPMTEKACNAITNTLLTNFYPNFILGWPRYDGNWLIQKTVQKPTALLQEMLIKHCQNPNSTWTQLKSWVWHENDFNPPPTTHPHKLNVSNISAVTDPISTKLLS